jgi:uncharacterized integral membrane protein
MLWRFIALIVVFAMLLTFITFNRSYQCNISFGFTEFTDVPVFLTIFISFALGLLCAFPLALKLRKRKGIILRKDRRPINDQSSASSAGSETDENIKQDAVSARERFFAKRRGGK